MAEHPGGSRKGRGVKRPTRKQRRLHPPWADVERALSESVPTIFPIDGAPPVQVFVAEGGVCLGLRTPYSPREEDPVGLPGELEFRATSVRGEPVCELTTGNRALFGVFYQFALS